MTQMSLEETTPTIPSAKSKTHQELVKEVYIHGFLFATKEYSVLQEMLAKLDVYVTIETPTSAMVRNPTLRVNSVAYPDQMYEHPGPRSIDNYINQRLEELGLQHVPTKPLYGLDHFISSRKMETAPKSP